MAELSFDSALRSYGGRTSPLSDPMDPLTGGFNQTSRALRSVISPVPQSGLFGASFASRLPTLGGGAGSGGGDREIEPGPLGTWEVARGRPHQQVGKFGVNLLGSGQGFAPGQPTPYQMGQPPDRAAQLRAMAAPENPDNRGFWEGLFGAAAGLFGEGAQGVGAAIGSGVDLPFEIAGNVAGLPLAAASAAPTWLREGGLDADIQQAYDELAAENPINGLLMWSQAAKAQWQRDTEQGRMTGLFADLGPATALTDQLGLLMNAVFATPMKAVQRGILGAGAADESIREVERAVAGGATVSTDAETGDISSSDSDIRSNVYVRLQERLARGDFGTPGTQAARDKMMDALVVEQGVLRAAGDEEQTSDFFFTGQGLADVAFSLVTDPLIIASLGVGAVAKGARLGTMAANAKFWTAVPREVLPQVMDDVERVAMRLGNYRTADEAWTALGRSSQTGQRLRGGVDPTLEARVYREVIQNPAYAEWRPQADSALSYIENWRSKWEPALRPVTEAVRNLNDPFRLFGAGRADAAMGSVYSAHATEGLIRGQGSLDAHANLQTALQAVPNEALATYNRGLGVAAAFEARVYHRNGLMADLRRRIRNGDQSAHDLMNQYLPDEVLRDRMTGSTAGDIASGMEKQALRVRPLYLATERGGGAAALTRAREEAAHRLQLMGVGREDATRLAGGMDRDQISLLDLSYFGVAMDSFVNARGAAMKSSAAGGAIDFERLSMLGPRQMTAQMAEQVLDAVSRGAIDEVREALRRYDILYENLGEGLDDTKLLNAVRDLLTDQLEAGALPRELDSLVGLTDDLRLWAEQHADLGYRIGFRPADDQMWRVSTDAEGRIIGVNPWVEVASTASDVPTYTRARLAKDMLFHAVRGERIMADARVRLAQYTSEKWGLSRGQSDALFARFLRMAQESGITPRGLSPEQVYQIVNTHGIGDEIMEGVGVRESIEALLSAFEGQWRHVGLTQKFTGGAKTQLGGQSNWIGQVAEKIYPMVRFTLNPLFQAQELTEPFILNLMRGIRPGFRASEMDERTLKLVEVLIRDSKYAYDDQIEYGATLLWGADSARAAFGPNSKLGKLTRAMALGDRINVKEVKRVNYARAMRRTLGVEFREAMERVSPDVAGKLRAHYATDDWGEIAVRYLTEKGMVDTPMDVLKPEHLGARNPVDLDKVARHFDDVADADALRAAVRAGMDETDFRDVLVNAGADPDFASRAYVTAAAQFTPEEWWDQWRVNFRAGNLRATNSDRSLMKAVAEVHGMSEAEYLAKYMADVPMSVDERALLALSEPEKRWFQFMAEQVDAEVGRPTQAVDEAIRQFRLKHAHAADREHFAIIDDSGEILAEGDQHHSWTVLPDGSHANASLGDEITPFLPLSKGRTLVHNHPTHNTLSPADITTGAENDVNRMVVTSPGITYILEPENVDEGWATEGFRAIYGDGPAETGFPPEHLASKMAHENYWGDVRASITSIWREEGRRVWEQLGDNPFYNAHSQFYSNYLDSIATNAAVQKVADMFGWKFTAITDFRLPADAAERTALLQRMADNPPVHLQREAPYSFRTEPMQRVDLKAGTAISFEYASRHRNWMPENLPEEVERAVMDGWEDWARARVATLFGTAVTDVRRARGGWMSEQGFTDTVNSVMDVWGTPDQVEDMAAAIGYLLKQDAVVTSRPKPGKHVADADAGERWSLQFIADKELTGEQATELARAVASAAPKVADWGSSVVTTADGRTAIRFVSWDQTGSVDRATFMGSEAVAEAGGLRLAQALENLQFTDSIEISPDVVDFRYIDNDWDGVASHGEGYLAGIRQRRPDVAGELERGLAEESENVLASLVRFNAPEQFDSHLAALRGRGESVPEFRAPGQYAPAPLADRLTVVIPGGRESLLDGERTFSLWEQQLLKAQVINPTEAYRSDPDLYTGMMQAIWRSKWQAIDADPVARYNGFAFAALTANAALDTTEGAFSLLRAQSARSGRNVRGLRKLTTHAQRLRNSLPEAFRDDPAALGIAFQMDEGLRVNGFQLHKASWLNPEERTLLDNVIQRIDNRMRTLKTDEERIRWAQRIQERLDGRVRRGRAGRRTGRGGGINRGNVHLQVHPFPTSQIENMANLDGYTSVGRPRVRFKGTATNTSWGHVLGWLASGLFTTDAPGVVRFLTPQPWESRDAWALRMSSILPGIDVKTAMMAVQANGPSAVTHGALDTHILRFSFQRAAERGELEDLLGRLSPGYAGHIRTEMRRMSDTRSTAFKSPRAERVYLVSDVMHRQPWSPEKLAHMRSRLHLIADPDLRAMYDDDVVLEYVSKTRGKVNLWGGDYAVIDDYFQTVLKADEVARLRADGHTLAADRVEAMSGGQWQWFKWDHIRGDAGVPLDPHVSVSRGAAMMPPRAGGELDRNIETSRLKTPYDPYNSMVLQQIDGRILGANQIMDDTRRVLLATQHVDGRTGLHELAHVFEQHLDPSMREQVLAQFRTATGSRRRTWSREVSEWWADSLLDFAKSGAKPSNKGLRSSFDYFRKTLNGVEATIKAQSEAKALERTKASAIRRATKAIERRTPALRDADAALRKAQGALQSANRDLRRARARASLGVLESRAGALRDDALQRGEMLKDARAAVRAASSEIRAAEVRATRALGTPSAGGLRAAVGAKRRALERAEAEVQRLARDLDKARAAANKASRAVGAARRRVPVQTFEQARDRARTVAEKASREQKVIANAMKEAKQSLADARKMSTRPSRAKVAPLPLSDDMKGIWDAITTPPASSPPTLGTGAPYDNQQEAVYQAARHALSRSEEDAFRLHYYKRGRSFIERSVNHPYFGLYPASYMWGKILPEMVRFLTRTPFGLDAPMGGLALSHNVYRGVVTQQQYDPEFRRKMAESTDLWHFMALLTPSLPWEVPVNAPLWMRRFADASLTYEDKVAETPPGGEQPPLMNLDTAARTGREMLNYAFGPAAAIEQIGAAVGIGASALDQTAQTVTDTVNDIVQQGVVAPPAPDAMVSPTPLGTPEP